MVLTQHWHFSQTQPSIFWMSTYQPTSLHLGMSVVSLWLDLDYALQPHNYINDVTLGGTLLMLIVTTGSGCYWYLVTIFSLAIDKQPMRKCFNTMHICPSPKFPSRFSLQWWFLPNPVFSSMVANCIFHFQTSFHIHRFAWAFYCK